MTDPAVRGLIRNAAGALSFLPWLALLGWLSALAWFLCDDAFISFRYARNLLEGHGLVFNPGEYVEGYTNFLWILELAALWGLLGIPPEQAAPWLSVACTAGVVAMLGVWCARLPQLRHRWLVTWMAFGLLCTSATFAVWTSGGGLEIRQFTLLTLVAAVCLSLWRSGRRGLVAASLSLTLAAWTRPEGLLTGMLCIGWFAVQSMADAGRPRPDWRRLAWLAAPFLALVAAHFLFRYAYYGEWLPNTYYAKHVRPWYESGFRYLWAAALETGLYLLLPLAAVAARNRWRACRDGTFALVLLLTGVHMAYVMRIGGDHFEYRPLDFYWPLLALPAAAGIVQLGSRLAAGRWRARFPGLGPRGWSIVIFVPVLFYAGAIQGALLFEGIAIRERIAHLHIELDGENAGWLLHAPGMPMLVAISNDLRRAAARQGVAARFTEHQEFARLRLPKWTPYGNMAREIIPDDALTAKGTIGIPFYFVPDLKAIDTFGLTDATIARNRAIHPNHKRRIAHDRRAPRGYLEERGVNITVHPAADTRQEALMRGHYAVQAGPELWMPFDSPDEEWVLDRFASRGLHMRDPPHSSLSWERAVPDFNRRLGDLGFAWNSVWDTWVQVFASSCTPDELLVWPKPNGEVDAPALHRWKINETGLCRTTVMGSPGWIKWFADDPSRLEGVGRAKAAIRSVFNVYLLENRLLYFKQPCRPDDIAATFLLHVFPIDERSLPDGRRKLGFDNLDFRMNMHHRFRGRCVAVRGLPDYSIAEIRTGQYTVGGQLWGGAITTAGPGSDGKFPP